MTLQYRRLRRLRGRGMTLIEILLVVAIIGILINVLVPALMHQIVKAQATRITSEYKLLEQAVLSYTTDAGEGPRPWFSTREHPDLVPYVQGRLDYGRSGDMLKLFLRYPDNARTAFRSGYLLYSYRPSPLIETLQRSLGGKVEVFWPGRLIVLVIER